MVSGAQTDEMWIGLINPESKICKGRTPVQNCLQWIDGTTYTPERNHEVIEETWYAYMTVWYHIKNFDANGGDYCVRMYTREGKSGDTDCSKDLTFLCQYDCNNIAGIFSNHFFHYSPSNYQNIQLAVQFPLAIHIT